jgi:prepilin-type N-terminal cleavage/methylation domain-containing protein
MKNQKGFSLIEVLVSLAILGVLSVGFFSGLATISHTTLQNKQTDTGRALAQSQMEYIKQSAYAENCVYEAASIPSEYAGYTATINAEKVNYDTVIQKITITIQNHTKTVYTLEDYKVQ